MTFENSAGLGVLNHYGVRTTNSSYGGVQETGLIKTVSIEITAPSTGISSAAWAVQGLDVVIPARSSLVSARFIVETAFDMGTALVVGTYKASDGTTVVDADGIITATEGAVANIDAVRDVIVGTGAQLTTGTAAAGALEFDTVIRALYTGNAPTVGKGRLIVEYLTATA